MKILSIETSCDETAIALVKASGGLKRPSFQVLKNLVASQIKIHEPWGGIVPHLAKREHLKNLPILFQKIIKKIKKQKPEILAITIGPGLEPCLWAGINFTKEIQKKYFPKTKLIGVNHLEGHLYSFLLLNQKISPKIFPAIALIVSGGHTLLLNLESLTQWKKIGETRDDAAGEAFDKVGRLLDLPFPGGPEIEKLAKFGNPQAINFPRPMIHQKNYDFSFSGLKTAVLYFLQKNPQFKNDSKLKADIAASFQQAVIDSLVIKTLKASQEYKAKTIILAGGVAANKLLRKTLKKQAQKLKLNFFAPPFKFNTDNAAMIAAAAYIQYLKNKNYQIEAKSDLNM